MVDEHVEAGCTIVPALPINWIGHLNFGEGKVNNVFVVEDRLIGEVDPTDKAECQKVNDTRLSPTHWQSTRRDRERRDGRTEHHTSPHRSRSCSTNSRQSNLVSIPSALLSTVDDDSHVARLVGQFNRPYRCILPYTSSQELPEISMICNKGNSLPVSSSTIWIGHHTCHL